jgi:hypothetical protein
MSVLSEARQQAISHNQVTRLACHIWQGLFTCTCHTWSFFNIFTSCRTPRRPPAELSTIPDCFFNNEYIDTRFPRCRGTNANGAAGRDPASLTDPFVMLYGCLYSYRRNMHDSNTACAHCYIVTVSRTVKQGCACRCFH